jgi:hypothetical protein
MYKRMSDVLSLYQFNIVIRHRNCAAGTAEDTGGSRFTTLLARAKGVPPPPQQQQQQQAPPPPQQAQPTYVDPYRCVADITTSPGARLNRFMLLHQPKIYHLWP